MGIGGFVFCILTRFLSNRSLHVMVDGCCVSARVSACAGTLEYLLEYLINQVATLSVRFSHCMLGKP